MEQHDEELIKDLLSENPALKNAYDEHTRLKRQVDDLRSRPYLSPTDEMETKNLQKRKLHEKDKIMNILAEHRKGQASQQPA